MATKRAKTAAKISFALIVAAAMVAVLVAVSYGHAMPVLDTHGLIADKERDLIYIVVGLGVLIVIPVFIMLFVIAWKYRASNTKAVYQPDYDSNNVIEAVWWGIPCVMILILAIITGYATHDLDPYKPIQSSVKPINVEVVALQWRWLFIYPDQNIATLNYLNIPEKTPINFTITADAPMNSFWVPALAGQVYAMSGMSTQLHVMADGTGTYDGSSANISGSGFADMTFKVHSMSSSDFTNWASQSATSPNELAATNYTNLAKPNSDKTKMTFMLMDPSLYNDIVMKTMGNSSATMAPGMSGMNM
jgi:cytochrome o ubiquinol oxidase subunit 2